MRLPRATGMPRRGHTALSPNRLRIQPTCSRGRPTVRGCRAMNVVSLVVSPNPMGDTSSTIFLASPTMPMNLACIAPVMPSRRGRRSLWIAPPRRYAQKPSPRCAETTTLIFTQVRSCRRTCILSSAGTLLTPPGYSSCSRVYPHAAWANVSDHDPEVTGGRVTGLAEDYPTDAPLNEPSTTSLISHLR